VFIHLVEFRVYQQKDNFFILCIPLSELWLIIIYKKKMEIRI